MTDLPPLPAEVSPSGVELWDWAATLSHAVQRRARMGELQLQIAKVACGDCHHWMKRSCPKERNDGGRKVGPSMNAPTCQSFQECHWAGELREQRRAELEKLRGGAA